MIINMHGIPTNPTPCHPLLTLWCHMLASEFPNHAHIASRWVYDPSPSCRAYVVEFLQKRGWQVTAYESSLTHGYVIADDCDQLVHWKLTV